jgi:hypothetical protein
VRTRELQKWLDARQFGSFLEIAAMAADLSQTSRLGPMPIDRGTEERLTVQQREGVAGLAK